MLELILALVIVLLLIAGMAIGVIMGRKPLKGSCGGVAVALGEENYTCDICGGDPNKCDEESGNPEAKSDSVALGYDAGGSR